ncbi:MAG: hypothetical protein U1E38_05650 [Rhodospirillales bacterium]
MPFVEESWGQGAWGKIVEAVGNFAGNLSLDVLKQKIESWLGLLDSQQQQAVTQHFSTLYNQNFITPLESRLPLYQAGGSHCVLLPMPWKDRNNGLGVFYDFCSCTCNAELSAPSMVAMEDTAGELAEGRGLRAAKGLMMPVTQQSRAHGVFQKSYNDTDQYLTAEGSVECDYTKTGRNEGEVRIVAKKDNLTRSQVVADNTYTVSFPS